MKVVVGSTSEPKVSAVKEAFKDYFYEKIQIVAVDVNSDVSRTPFSVDECIRGCRNRINRCKEKVPDADYYVGIESGILKTSEFCFLGAWAVILNAATGKESIGSSALVPLPSSAFTNISPDVRISETMNYGLFDSDLVKKKSVLGVGGIITHGLITRHNQVSLALKVALSLN